MAKDARARALDALVDIEDGLKDLTASVARLVDRYFARKKKDLTGDEKKLVTIIYEEIGAMITGIENISPDMKGLCVSVQPAFSGKKINMALEALKEIHDSWQVIKSRNARELDALMQNPTSEEVRLFVTNLKILSNLISFNVARNQWRE